MKKRFLPILLALTMCLSLLPGTALAEGEPQPDLTISTKEQLIEFRNEVNAGTKSYAGKLVQLGADINLNNEAWTPIGKDYDHPFQGTFDGNGKTISGLNINVTNSSSNTTFYYGLFGCVKTDENSNGGTLQNLAVSGSVSVEAAGQVRVGGIVGRSYGTIQNCQFSGSVSGSCDTYNCFGGVVGYAAIITNSYNTGTVSGSVSGNSSSRVGGVVGYAEDSVSNSYNTGTVSGSGDYSKVGGVAGYVKGSVSDCFYLTGTADKGVGNDKAGTTAITAEQFAEKTTFTNAGWDFTENTGTWVMGPFGRPLLAWETASANADGSENNPYQIASVFDLKLFRDLVNNGTVNTNTTPNIKYSEQHYQLTTDLKLNEAAVPTWDTNTKDTIHFWTPIGSTAGNTFTGTFDGNGHTISGLAIDATTAGYYGLFGYIENENTGTLQNLAVSGSVSVTATGQVWVGGIVGRSDGAIQNCQFSGSVSGTSTSDTCYVGGVAGFAENSVSNCYNTGSASLIGSGYVGGVVGDVGNVSNCYNTGTVSGSGSNSKVGGVAGSVYISVSNCFYLTGTGGTNDKGVGEFASDSTSKDDATKISAGAFTKPDTFPESWFATGGAWVMGPFRPLLSWEAAAKTMGTGDSANSPYKISTVSDLEELSLAVNAGEKYSGKYFQLTADLKLNEDAVPDLTAKNTKTWTPIGNGIYPFNGTFDGNGHTISGLAINVADSAAGQYHYGLFGYVGDDKNPTVKNLAVSGNVSATSTDAAATFYVGGIVGYTKGTIQNCHFSGKVSGSVSRYGCFGGVAGYAYNSGSISNCYNTGSVSLSGSGSVGGVAGQTGSNVSNCFYLKDTGSALQGIGNKTDAAGVEAASAERFASGEIAWKLQNGQKTQIWGQTLPGKNGDSPVLTADTTKRVYQVTIDTKETNTDADKTISYTNGIVTEPNPAPTKGGSAFRGWFVSTGENSYSQFDFSTPVNSDVTLLANWDCALGHPGTFT